MKQTRIDLAMLIMNRGACFVSRVGEALQQMSLVAGSKWLRIVIQVVCEDFDKHRRNICEHNRQMIAKHF